LFPSIWRDSCFNKMAMRHQNSLKPATREFFAIALFTIVVNVLFQGIFSLAPSIHPVLRGAMETLAVALLIVPPAYYFYMRPFLISLAERQTADKRLRKSEMHYRIVSELTTTFVFDLVVAEDGTVSLDFVSDNFYSFTGRTDHNASFESFLGHIHPEDSGKLAHVLQRLIAEPQSTEIECRAFVDDPHVLKWLSICGRSEWDGKLGRVAAISGAVKDITERKRADEDRARVQNLLEVSQRLAHIGSWEYELSSGTLSWSDEMYRIAGLPVGSPIGREIVESFFPPGDLARSRKALATIFSADFSYSTDYTVNLRDGQSRIIHNEGELIRDENGNAVRVCGTTQDITERKRSEAALRASEQIIEAMLNAIPAGVFWKDTKLAFVGCNRTFAHDAGFEDQRDIIGKNDFEIGCPEELAHYFRDIDRRIIESGMAMTNVEDSMMQKGTLVTHLASIVPLRNLDGEISGVLGTYVDITERKRAEEALKENEEKFRSITEQSTDGIIVTDENGAIVEWNRAQEILTGLKRSVVVGQPAWEVEGMLMPRDLNTLEQIARIREKVKGLLRGDGRFPANERVEHSIVVPDGGTKIVSEHIFVIKKSGGNMIVSILTDITEKKRAESDRATVEQYLQQTQKLESLGVLAGGIAHDFNNLLSGVFGFMDLARSRVLDEKAAEYLSRAGDSIERAKGLTQQLLTFSKGGEPIRKIVPVAPLIRETCDFALSGANVKCAYGIARDLWHCNIDRNQIGQVFQNLMLNAIQAMPLGGLIEVLAENVSLGEKEHPLLVKGDYVLIAVKDSGTGISKEMLPRIFDPFFTTKTKGHGLGLATTFSIVKRHNGTINVESELGKGSTFQIYLPADRTAASKSIRKHDARHTGNGRILVMDDDEAIRLLLSRTLESLGYSVVCKEDGVSTIDWFKAEAEKGTPPSAVMLDLTIPGGMGGREVAEEIRKLNREIPIFVSSGYAEDPVIANPLNYGITASLSKPFKRVELVEMLEKHMRKDP
jgi:two-component system, cell cycle sensor histidine kinase and response regulator CckA